jgi:capsular exopolysaccharide synthesis family protein
MVREESLGKNTTEKNGNEFNDIGFVEQKSNVNNVIRHYKSLDVLMEVAHRVDSTLKDGYLIYKAEEIQSRLAIEIENDNSTILDITYRDYSTPKAELVLGLILQVYKEKYLESKRQATLSTSQFIDSRLTLLEHDLDIVDDSIAQYKSQYGITDLGHVSDLYLQQQSSSDAEILRLTSQKSMAEFIRGMLEHESSEPQLLLVNSGINNSVIEAQITLYNSLLMQLQSHQNYTSSQNPLILNQEKELEAMRKRILANIKNHIHTIDIQLSSLTNYYDEATSKVVSNPSQAKYLATIERERKVKESLYMFLLQKKEENEISITYNSDNTVILEQPHGSGKPTSPKRLQILLAALFIGFLGPITVIFLRASFDDSVRDRYDVERNCDIPFLGEIPYSGREHSLESLLMRFGIGRKAKSAAIVVGHDMLNASNEAFRVLRNNMDASLAGKSQGDGGRTYLLKSTQIEVGKTFVGMNLALVKAIAGERVLFIDCDLRQASASRLWRTPLLGLTDYMHSEESDYRKLLWHVDGYPTLDVLPAGALPTNPTEMLQEPFFEQLLNTVRQDYDSIIIDSPSAGILADADIIERFTDCTLFVVRAGQFNRHRLSELSPIEVISGTAKPQYIILNGVDIHVRYGFAYSHKYERSEEEKKVTKISKKTILLNKVIFKKKNNQA